MSVENELKQLFAERADGVGPEPELWSGIESGIHARARRATLLRTGVALTTIAAIAVVVMATRDQGRHGFVQTDPTPQPTYAQYQEPRLLQAIDVAREQDPDAKVLVAVLTQRNVSDELIGIGKDGTDFSDVALIGLEGDFTPVSCPATSASPSGCDPLPRIWSVVTMGSYDIVGVSEMVSADEALVEELRELSLFLDARASGAGAHRWIGEHAADSDLAWVYRFPYGRGDDYRSWDMRDREVLGASRRYKVSFETGEGTFTREVIEWGPGRNLDGETVPWGTQAVSVDRSQVSVSSSSCDPNAESEACTEPEPTTTE